MSDVVSLNNTAITEFVKNIEKLTNRIKTVGKDISNVATQSFNTLKISVKLAGDQIKTFANNRLENLREKIKKSKDSIKEFGGKFKSSIGSIASVAANIGGKVISFAKDSVGAAQTQMNNEKNLASALKLRTSATQGQIDSILKLTSAQQANGVVSDEVQMAGAGQLATYASNTASIKTLIPAMNNLLVSQKGLNGTSDDAAAVADLMGKGLKGQTEELEEAGIGFSDAQKKVLQFGSEEEKAAVLAQAINDKVGDANKEMSNTDVGAIQKASNLFLDLKESIGNMLLPYLAKFANWFSEHESQIKTVISSVIGTIIGAVKKIFMFIEKHPEIIEFVIKALGKFKEFGAYLSTVIPPILKKLAQWFTTTILPVLAQIGSSLLNLWNKVILPFIKTVFPIIKQYVISCFAVIGSVVEGGLKVIHGLIDFVTGVFTGDWSTAWQGVLEVFGGIFSGLAGILAAPLNAVIGLINGVIDSINNSIQIDIPDWVPLFGGKHLGFDIQRIDSVGSNESKTENNTKSHNALGTSYWKGGLSYINERGGEIVDLPNGSKVIPADKSDRLLSGNGVSIGNIYITAKGVTVKDVVNEIVPQLKLQLANM